MTCQCQTTPSGIITCDYCAAQMISMVTDLLGEEVELPTVLTPAEYEGLQSAVNGWQDWLNNGLPTSDQGRV
jgi:hypothetical protein